MPPPPHLVFDCEVLTPMFVAGAEQNGAPELRPASVRGMLRYWYRALLGGRGYTGRRLAEEEAKVFGSAGMGGVEARATAVDVLTRVAPDARVEKRSKERYRDNQGREGKRPRSDLLKPGSGSGYLWYSAALGENDRGFYPSGTRFQVALVAPRGDRKALALAGAAFWLLAHLGGLGTRNRHGAGSFTIRDVRHQGDIDQLPAFVSRVDGTRELADFLSTNLRLIKNWIQPAGAPPATRFDVLAPGLTQIIVAGEEFENPVKAAAQIGTDLQDFRSGSLGRWNNREGRFDRDPLPERRAEMLALKRFAATGSLPPGTTLRNPTFGLPYMVQFLRQDRAHGEDDVVNELRSNVSLTISHPDTPRRASPLQMHVAESGDGYHDVVLTHFRSQFLKSGSPTLTVSDGRRRASASLGRDLIPEFFDHMRELQLDFHDEVRMREVEVPA